MKPSNYNESFKIEDKCCIYNSITRKYILYPENKEEIVDNVLNSLNKNEFSEQEVEILEKLIKNGIVVEDGLTELDKITYLTNKSKYQDRRFILIISPTLDCNFRCPYCFETRKKTYLNEEVINNIIDFVRYLAKNINTLQVGWFGGEPLLMYSDITKMNRAFKEICNKEGCNYESTITTNGYLLNDERIEALKEFNLKRIQITLDGDREIHNIKRPLADGNGTFDKIVENIIKIVNMNINVNLRINVDKNNEKSLNDLFEVFPKNQRDKININMCNIFQNKEYVKLYPIYKDAIDKGYIFKGSRKQFQICEGSFINSITVQPDGKISPCQMCNEKGFDFGYLGKGGKLIITNESEFYKFRAASPLDNEKCIKCNKLPLCLGGCYYKRYKNNSNCIANEKGQQEFWETIKLEVYSDIKHNLVDQLSMV